jgi:hypothetical protein
MRHPARGPVGTTGIDGKPIAANRRRRERRYVEERTEAAA